MPKKTKRKTTARTTVIKQSDKPSDELITFVLIADSPIYRMKSYGPASLMPINNYKLIDYQINSIKKSCKNYEIILCLGYETNKVFRYVKNNHKNSNVRIIENQNYTNTNSCESLRLSLNNTLNDKIFIIDGNLFFTSDDIVIKNNNSYSNMAYTIPKINDNFEVGVNINANNQVEFFSFGAQQSWLEMIYLGKSSAINSLSRIINNETYSKKFTFEAFNELLTINTVNIHACQPSDEVWKINKPKRNWK